MGIRGVLEYKSPPRDKVSAGFGSPFFFSYYSSEGLKKIILSAFTTHYQYKNFLLPLQVLKVPEFFFLARTKIVPPLKCWQF